MFVSQHRYFDLRRYKNIVWRVQRAALHRHVYGLSFADQTGHQMAMPGPTAATVREEECSHSHLTLQFIFLHANSEAKSPN